MGVVMSARGTTNGNARGSSYTRRRRREWLVETYRANTNVNVHVLTSGSIIVVPADCHGQYSDDLEVINDQPACRCYRCGCLLTVDTVTVDRIIPGVKGGTYRRNNIRPACGHCNSETGARLAHQRRRS